VTTATLRVSALQKSFGDYEALRSVGFSVPTGAITGLIGPNGSGKTTLMECVAGLLDPDKGDVTMDEVTVATGARRQQLFYMPEGVRPWPAQRVAWALRYFASIHGAEPARIRYAIDALQLRALLQSRMADLSKGEHRRVLLALALQTSHPLLLLDEPFDGLDLRQTRQVMRLLRDEAASGRTLLLSIHQLHDAEAICDHLVLLSNGSVAGEGTLAELRGRIGRDGASLEEVFLALT
jgi:ABC-2 type transport system ATP-binding protein